MLHGKIREQLQGKLSDTDEGAKVQVVVGLRWLDVFPEETLFFYDFQAFPAWPRRSSALSVTL